MMSFYVFAEENMNLINLLFYDLNKYEFSPFKECKDGTYVLQGKCVKCQGVCMNNAPCNKSTGKCDNGCIDHWTGKFCEGT